MALTNIIGIDHAVVVVKDLGRAAESWTRLGFTVSPQGTHSAKMGSANHTIVLGPDYVELLGVLTETDQNAPMRSFLAVRGEGVERLAFAALDATAGAEEIRLHGYTPIGPIEFGRPVKLPNGDQSEAKFSVFQWPLDEAPGGIRIFACQHRTPDKVWIAELQKHANTARRLKQVIIISSEPEKDAKQLAHMIDREICVEQAGTFFVPSGSDRADVLFLTQELFGRRFSRFPMVELPKRGAAALVFIAENLVLAERAVGTAGLRIQSGVIVPPAAANGVLLAFVAT
jgi:Glyoxalase-like domain